MAQQELQAAIENESEDDDYEDGRELEMFEIFANTFTTSSQSSTMPSSRQHSHTQQLVGVEPAVSRPSHRFYSGAMSSADAPVCCCFQTLTEMLCHARTLGRRNLNVGLDVVLEQSRPMLSAISQFLQCYSCSSDPQVFLQVLMIFQTVFQLYRSLIHSPGTSCPQLDIRIGNFNVSHGYGHTVKMLVIIVEIGSAKKVLDTFATRVDQLSASDSQVQFLKNQTQSLVQGLKAIAKALNLPDISSLVRQ